MFLLLGDRGDPWCNAFESELRTRGHPSRITNNPFEEGTLSWKVEGGRSSSRLQLNADELQDDQLSGVFVRSSGWIDPAGWQPEDLRYMQTETQAALLGWLWSLDCPVINRYNSWIWYHPNKPLLLWFPMLRSCGLPTPARLITNVESAAKEFSAATGNADTGLPAAVYAPLTSQDHYLIADGDWDGLAALFRVTPGQLSHPHAEVNVACIIGATDIVWNNDPSPELLSFEPAVRELARRAGLDFLEIAFSKESGRTVVVAVEAFPRFEHFGTDALAPIVRKLADRLAIAPRRRRFAGPNYGGAK